MQKVLVVGLGKIARGLIIPIFKEAGYTVVGAGRSASSLPRLDYTLQTPSRRTTVGLDDIIATDSADNSFDLIVTSVGRHNLGEVSTWYRTKKLSAPVLLAENLPDAVNLFPEQIPIVIDRICPRIVEEDSLTVVAEDYYRIAIQDHPLTRQLGRVAGVELKKTADEIEQIRRQKMFTVNTSHLLAAAYGQRLGCHLVEEVMANPEITARIHAIVYEVSPWLGFEALAAVKRSAKIVERFAAPMQDPLPRIFHPGNYSAAARYMDVPLNELRAMGRKAPILAEASAFLTTFMNSNARQTR